jgi:hypothetical protein
MNSCERASCGVSAMFVGDQRSCWRPKYRVPVTGSMASEVSDAVGKDLLEIGADLSAERSPGGEERIFQTASSRRRLAAASHR